MPALAPVAAILAQTATPTPQPTMIVDEAIVTPGPIGFFAMLFVGVATLLLVLDLVRRVRRVRYRGEIRERLLAERAEEEVLAGASPGADERDALDARESARRERLDTAEPDIDALPPLDSAPEGLRASADTVVLGDDDSDPAAGRRG